MVVWPENPLSRVLLGLLVVGMEEFSVEFRVADNVLRAEFCMVVTEKYVVVRHDDGVMGEWIHAILKSCAVRRIAWLLAEVGRVLPDYLDFEDMIGRYTLITVIVEWLLDRRRVVWDYLVVGEFSPGFVKGLEELGAFVHDVDGRKLVVKDVEELKKLAPDLRRVAPSYWMPVIERYLGRIG